MKRKERHIVFRVFNAISAVISIISCIYIFIFELSMFAMAGFLLPLFFISTQAVVAGEGVVDILFGTIETFFHAVIDAVIGILEAIWDGICS